MSTVTVFGGTGFLGHRIVAKLLAEGVDVRVATRHPGRASAPQDAKGQIIPVQVDIHDSAAVAAAISGVDGVVNAVSLYIERGNSTFHSIHVEGAHSVAQAARKHGVKRLLHLSGIGADPTSPSDYIRARGDGESAVREAFADATIFRPSVMFGPDDAFLNTLASLSAWLPVLPLFAEGNAKLQPVFVADVAQAAAHVLAGRGSEQIYELGGPNILSYRQLLEMVLRSTHRRRLLLPVPIFVWDGLAATSQLLPSPPLTEAQVALLKQDNVTSPEAPGLQELNVSPTPLKTILDKYFAQT